MKSNKSKKVNNVDRSLLLLSSLDSNHTETVNTLVRGNAKTINIPNAKDNEKSKGQLVDNSNFTWN